MAALVDVIVMCGAVESKAEARRLAKQNAISVDGKKVQDLSQEITNTDAFVLGVGKTKEFLVFCSGSSKSELPHTPYRYYETCSIDTETVGLTEAQAAYFRDEIAGHACSARVYKFAIADEEFWGLRVSFNAGPFNTTNNYWTAWRWSLG